MTVRMFRMAPGATLLYRIRPVGGPARPPLVLSVRRPDEGTSPELELEVRPAETEEATHAVRPAAGNNNRSDARDGVTRGRVRLDEGYLAVVLEVRRQIEELGPWGRDEPFDLVYEEPREESERRAAEG